MNSFLHNFEPIIFSFFLFIFFFFVPDKIRAPISMSSMSNGQTVILNSGTGGSQFISSGYDTKGVPYYRAIEQAIVNNVLKHIERIYNSTTDKFDIIGYTLDLADPKSKPIPIGKAK